MTIEESNIIDIVATKDTSDEVLLTISDHLPWEENEERHLLLQDKINTYLQFVESGQIYSSVPAAKGRNIVINIVGKFPLSQKAEIFIREASKMIESAGLRLQFKYMPAE